MIPLISTVVVFGCSLMLIAWGHNLIVKEKMNIIGALFTIMGILLVFGSIANFIFIALGGCL